MKASARLTILIFTLALSFTAYGQTSPGSLDPDFGISGSVETPVGGIAGLPSKMAVQADGKILMSGSRSFGDNTEMVVVRYEADGMPDLGFGVSGQAAANFGEHIAAATDIAIQPDGKIVLVGFTTFGEGNVGVDFALARFNANGTLDTSFDRDGKLMTSFGGNFREIAYGVAIQPDGKIVTVGVRQAVDTSESWFAIARYNSNGSLDTSFDGDGLLIMKGGVLNEVGNTARDVVIQPDGKIVIAGEIWFTIATDIVVVRLNPDGTLDATFDGDGKVRTSVSQFDDSPNAVKLQPDGKIIVAGFADVGSVSNRDNDFALVRYLPNGGLDPSFDTDGKLTISFAPSYTNEQAQDIALSKGGDIFVGGQGGSGFPLLNSLATLAKLTSDGSPDPEFGTDGKAFAGFSGQVSVIYSAAVQNDGKVLAGIGTGNWNQPQRNIKLAVARFLNFDVPRITPFDYDGDGKADVSVFRPSTSDWFLQGSQTGYTGRHFGQAGDIITPADYDGDGKTDIAVFRPSTGGWYWIRSSDSAVAAVTLGQPGDIPIPADYDGDHRADPMVFRPSTGDWLSYNSGNGQNGYIHFGMAGDKPAEGDFDGDGIADRSVFRPSTGSWYRLNSSNWEFFGFQFGSTDDAPVPADYDGDGKTDIAVYRPALGDWYVLNSGAGNLTALHFGQNGDLPTAADYDGDGKADISVFRPTDGNWYQQTSTSGYTSQHFGAAGDIPTPNAFVY